MYVSFDIITRQVIKNNCSLILLLHIYCDIMIIVETHRLTVEPFSISTDGWMVKDGCLVIPRKWCKDLYSPLAEFISKGG